MGLKSNLILNLFMYLLHTARALSILCTCVQYGARTRPFCFVRGLNAAQNCPKLANVGFLAGQNGFPGPVQPDGAPDAPLRCITVPIGLHRCLLILRSAFHGVTQKYGRKSLDCFSGLFLVNGKSCKFLKISPTLQRRPRKGLLKHCNSRAWPGGSSAASYDLMRCLL